jgi:hypothetical protein
LIVADAIENACPPLVLMLPNERDHRLGANDCRLSTEASSPGSVHPFVGRLVHRE